MATTDQELKTLNKTVNEAVNILKMYVGSSAQVKAMNEKEREMLEKWLKITDLEEENQKRQRAFTERARDANGRFIKKREGAWGKFLDMAESTMKVGNKMTFGIAGKVKNMMMGIASHFTRVFQEIKSHFLSLFGEESEWFGLISAIKDSIVDSAKGMWEFLFHKTPKWAKKQTKILKQMLMLQIKKMKLDWQDMSAGVKKKGGIWGILGGILLGIAAGIGAWLQRYLILLSKLPVFAKILKMFSFIEDIPFIGKLLKAVKFGFKWLGWPLTLLLSAIDFMKGYSETEGSRWEKIKAGIWEAFKGFIELPLKFIGWITEKVLGLFGIEIDGLAENWMKNLKTSFDWIMGGGFIEPIKKALTAIWNFVADLMNGAIQMIADLARKVGMDDFAKSLETMRVDRIESGITANPVTTLNAAEKARGIDVSKADAIIAQRDEMKKWREEGAKKAKESKEGTYAHRLGNFLGFGGNDSGSGDVKQVPDEIDNYLLGVGVANGALQ